MKSQRAVDGAVWTNIVGRYSWYTAITAHTPATEIQHEVSSSQQEERQGSVPPFCMEWALFVNMMVRSNRQTTSVTPNGSVCGNLKTSGAHAPSVSNVGATTLRATSAGR
jgi:hypothetical protein